MIRPLSSADKMFVGEYATRIVKGMKEVTKDLPLFDRFNYSKDKLISEFPKIQDVYERICAKNPNEASWYYEKAYQNAWIA